MSKQSQSPSALEDVRREIDEIDGALLDLLRQRFAVSVKVKQLKAAAGQAHTSPIRPAREAIVMRRLIAACNAPLPVGLMLRIWREIISSSTLIQADATVHASHRILADPAMRDLIKLQFGQIPLIGHDTDDMALSAAAETQAAVAVMPTDANWLHVIGNAGEYEVGVIGALPFFDRQGQPELVIIGAAYDEPTGQDETLLCSAVLLPGDLTPAPLWQLELATGGWLTSLPVFLSASQMPLVGLSVDNDELALRVLGRYPSPINIDK